MMNKTIWIMLLAAGIAGTAVAVFADDDDDEHEVRIPGIGYWYD